MKQCLDTVLMVFLGLAVVYGMLFSLPQALGVPVLADSPWPPFRALHGWAVTQEPAHLNPPLVLRLNAVFDAFVQAPLLLAVMYGWWRGRTWVRPLAAVYAGAAVTNMFFYFATTFLGAHPPLNLALYLPLNLPWLFAPVWLLWRVLQHDWPFRSKRPQGQA